MDFVGADVTQPARMNLPRLVERIRNFIRDHEELNRLTLGKENSDSDILEAIEDVLNDFNNTPPFYTIFNLTNLPPLNIVKLGAIVYLLKSVGLLNTRNSIQYSDGGVNVNMDKTPAIQAWIQMIQNEYEEKKAKFKIASNIENSWGAGVSSEYVLINTQALLENF
jgi:hypothetical protein